VSEETDRQTDRQTDRKTDRQTDRQTVRQRLHLADEGHDALGVGVGAAPGRGGEGGIGRDEDREERNALSGLPILSALMCPILPALADILLCLSSAALAPYPTYCNAEM
jgi:hypothetical protein